MRGTVAIGTGDRSTLGSCCRARRRGGRGVLRAPCGCEPPDVMFGLSLAASDPHTRASANAALAHRTFQLPPAIPVAPPANRAPHSGQCFHVSRHAAAGEFTQLTISWRRDARRLWHRLWSSISRNSLAMLSVCRTREYTGTNSSWIL